MFALPSSVTLAAESAAVQFGGADIGIQWWLITIAVIVGFLLVDLLVVHRDAHVVSAREAAKWSAIWIGLGLAFAVVIWAFYPDGGTAAGEYLSGYLIEKSLSVDNLFVFVLIFSYFKVPDEYQHRVLFWGILGALVFRGIFIALGAVLLAKFSWVAFIFGGFLIFTGLRIARESEVDVHPENNPVLKIVRKILPITNDYHGQSLTFKENGKRVFTPLFAVLVVVETTDVIFAVDSIPAIFGVTGDPFLVFTSNAFALLGLRALFFLLASAVRRFVYLGPAIAMILVMVGIKLIAEEAFDIHVPAWQPLVLIAVILGIGIFASMQKASVLDTVAMDGDAPGDGDDEPAVEPSDAPR